MKKCFVTLLFVLLAAIMSLTAYATESGGDEITFQCNVTFFITDETTNGYPGSSFTAVMTDTTKTITDSYSFTKGNSWGGNNTPKYTVIAPTTYTVTFEGLEDGYMIVNTFDLSSDISFEAVDGGVVDCYWSIIETATTAETNGETGTGSALLEQEEKGTYTVSDEEAEEVYKSFLDTVGYIANSEEWYNALLINFELFGESTYAKWYAEYVENGTEEEFLSMSLFDRFVWTETYLVYAWAVNTGDVSTYFGSEENFESHITSHITNMIESAPDYEAVEDAYLTLAKWQYDYVQETGVPYNFISGRSYLEEVGEVPEVETQEKTDEEELEEAAKELLEDADEATKEETTEERGVWSDTLEALSKNILTITIIIILCIAIMVVVWKRKRLNVSDNRDSNSNIDSTSNK
jgi:hypothetical protein